MLGVDRELYRRVPQQQPRYPRRPASRAVQEGDARSKVITLENWETYASSPLSKWMLAFNVAGALAHGIGIVLTLTQARMDFQLGVFSLDPVNRGNETHPKIGVRFNFSAWMYPAHIIVVFFGLSFTFHLTISCFLAAHLIIGPGWLTNWYMKGLYQCVAFWVRYSHTLSMYTASPTAVSTLSSGISPSRVHSAGWSTLARRPSCCCSHACCWESATCTPSGWSWG